MKYYPLTSYFTFKRYYKSNRDFGIDYKSCKSYLTFIEYVKRFNLLHYMKKVTIKTEMNKTRPYFYRNYITDENMLLLLAEIKSKMTRKSPVFDLIRQEIEEKIKNRDIQGPKLSLK